MTKYLASRKQVDAMEARSSVMGLAVDKWPEGLGFPGPVDEASEGSDAARRDFFFTFVPDLPDRMVSDSTLKGFENLMQRFHYAFRPEV